MFVREIVKRINNTIKHLGIWGGIRYRVALELKKRNIPILKNKMWKFHVKSRNFDFWVRPFFADIFFLRAMILGRNLNGVGEYDIEIIDNKYPANDKELIIIDLGANIGIFTLIMASKYPNAKIFALEPDPDNFKILLKNTKGNDNVQCLNVGIWNKKCKLRLINQGCESMSFRFKESPEGGISAVSVDNIMKKFNLNHVDVLKMDIEGSEKAVFEINTNWCKNVDVFLIETHDYYVEGSSEMVDRVLIEEMGLKRSQHEENKIYYK